MAQVEDQDIYWLEEPVATEDLEGSALVAQQLITPWQDMRRRPGCQDSAR
jgi:L-alanine-DL-glutamate epimerase-like enolase superfamily enzyme